MRIITTLLTILLLTSCNENEKSKQGTTPDNKVEISKSKHKITKTSQTITTSFGGNWVNKNYVNKLLATQSPRKSQDVSPITMLVLPNVLNKEATVVYGFHEGTKGNVVKKNGVFEIQSVYNTEPELIFHMEKDNIKSEKDEFVRMKAKDSKSDYNIVEQLLFAGKYDIDGKEVVFTSNGEVTGLDNFSYYSVLIDYYDAGMQVDQIRLGKSVEKSKLYGFEFKRDKLTIYELKCVKKSGDYCEVVKNGKRLYKLIKR